MHRVGRRRQRRRDGYGLRAVGDSRRSGRLHTGFGGYVFDNRVLIPTFITDQYPGLEAVFATSEAAGTNPTATFTVDTHDRPVHGFRRPRGVLRARSNRR